MTIKNSLQWLFSNQTINKNQNFKLFISKSTYLTNRLLLKIFKTRNSSENLRCYIPNFLVIRNKFGFLAKVDDGFSLIMFTRNHEPEVLERIELKKNSVFFDVGASLGFYSLFAAKKCPNGLIISIEPDRDLYEKILENLKMNNFENVKCINCAISDVDKSKIKLFKGMNSTIFGSGDNYSLVESRTLDGIVSDFKLLQIDWLKIDVESAEVMVLKGAKKTLEMTKNLILEIHSKKNGEECLEILDNQGFEIEIIKKSLYKEERPIEILNNMEDTEGNILYYPLILAKNKKIS